MICCEEVKEVWLVSRKQAETEAHQLSLQVIITNIRWKSVSRLHLLL